MQHERVFSGIQPTGALHIGNYLGAIKQFVSLQDRHPCLYCIVDLHAITATQDPQSLTHHVRHVAAAYLACGVDPQKSFIFNQARVGEHAKMAWLLNCVARVGWLSRMTQFKDKAGKDKEGASVGLYAYPVLMAADILTYHATHVPIGEDQSQHLELARDIARKFNLDFGVDFFPLPQGVLIKEAMRVMSLRDASKKMSKSHASALSRLELCDDNDSIARKIQKAKTDLEPLPSSLKDLEERPEIKNLLSIYAALQNISLEKVVQNFSNSSHSVFKKALIELCVEVIGPIREEILRLEKDTSFVDNILETGAQRARCVARPIYQKTAEIFGLSVTE